MFAPVGARVCVCVIDTDYKNGICEGRHASHIFMFLFRAGARVIYVNTTTFGPICVTHSYVSKACYLLDTFFLCQETKIRNIFVICSFWYVFAIFRFLYVLCLTFWRRNYFFF